MILPVETLTTILRYAEREHSRMVTWLELGAHESYAQDATDLVVAVTQATRSITHGSGGSMITLPALTAATLRYFADRELARIVGLSQWMPDDDLQRQEAELRPALKQIPVTLKRDTVLPCPPVQAAGTAPAGAHAHG
ncbi:hypothetical protein TSA6c_17125 [Azospirillum sp. TSA6c]|nr:hypothetical protein TSA6c_17125 [Azospirillum sp. TSA6c]